MYGNNIYGNVVIGDVYSSRRKSYSDFLSKISRTPVSLVIITLDFCSNVFGQAPCTATGTPCYNTFPTCKDKIHYSKTTRDYKITSADAPLPFKAGERPYIKDMKHLPTEIKDNLTINARVTINIYDEPDTDIGIDPYVSQRSSIQGTYWKKLLARNPNYKSRTVKIYEGFRGLIEAGFQQKFIGAIDNITSGKSGEVKIECVDLLKAIANIEVPPKLDIKLLNNIDDTQTEMTLTSVVGLDAPGYIRIGDEIIYYTTKNETTNVLSGCTRGYFATTSKEHKAKDKVQKVRYYPPANPFDILKEMLLTDAGISSLYVDTAAFDFFRDWPGGEVNFSAIISEPTKLDKLYFEIVDLIDCKSWVAEDLKITIKRNIPNEPDRQYTYLTDESNIINNSASVDLNEKSRITRVLLYWDKSTLGKIDEIKEYNRLDIAVDADAEHANEYNEVIEKKFFCRWLRSGYIQEETMAGFIKLFVMRQVRRYRDAMPIITLDIELKDSDIKTGDFVKISTDEMLAIDGKPLDKAIFQVSKRDFKGHKINLKVLKFPSRKVCLFAPAGTPDYTSATEAQKEYGFFSGANGKMSNEDDGYYFY